MKKPITKTTKICNCLSSELSGFISEYPDKTELIIDCFAYFLEAANVDVDITVNVLDEYVDLTKNEYAKEASRNLKAKYGF
jgi:hypothetical protein